MPELVTHIMSFARRAAPLSFCIGAIVTASCGGGADSGPTAPPAPAPIPVASVEIASVPGLVVIGFPTSLSVIARDASGRPLAGRTATWTSSDTTVAQISAEGSVRGFRVGMTDVKVTVEGVSSLPLRIYVAGGLPVVVRAADPNLRAVVGQAVSGVVAARVLDVHEAPVPGVPVTIVVASGGGTISERRGAIGHGGAGPRGQVDPRHEGGDAAIARERGRPHGNDFRDGVGRRAIDGTDRARRSAGRLRRQGTARFHRGAGG